LNTTYILWCPHLSFGGSEKHALELAKAAQGRADIEIWVDSENVEWGRNYLQSFGSEARIFAGVGVLGQAFVEDSVRRLGARRLAFHIVNAPAGFQALPYIATLPNADYYLSAFGDSVLSDGRKVSQIRFLDQSIRRGAKRVFTDSVYYRDVLAQDGVVGPDQLTVVAHPPAVRANWQREQAAGKLLWASRISDEKRLEDVIAIAVAFPMLALHMYGGIDRLCCSSRGDALLRALQVLPNVKLMGEYRKFDDIPVSDYDALLYTSERDGLPNVLLEAGAAGMPVLSTIVGGIGELLDEDNSFSKPNARVTDYIAFLTDLYSDYALGRGKGARLRSDIAGRSAHYPLEEVLDAVLGGAAPAARAAAAALPVSRIEAGHDPFFVQKLPVSSSLRGTHRNQVFASLCDGRSVLHVGCADAPITDIGNNLHLALQGCAKTLDGFDLDTAALDMLRPHLRQGRLFSNFDEVGDDYELVIVPEVIEHVNNVEQFLQTLDRINFSEIVITAPDLFSCMNRYFDYDAASETFVEIVHPDHNVWYSPYTLLNTVRKYTNWNVEGLFFLDPTSIMLVATKGRPA